jgi:hypothetical protein
MSLVPPLAKALSTFPVLSRVTSQLHVYTGFPDEQAWLAEALMQAQVCGTSVDVRSLQELGPLGLGAPLGIDAEESTRVARATGVFIDGTGEEATVTGSALAHSRCWAYWMPSEDGPVLKLELQEPTSFGWGSGKDRLAREQLKAVCLRQLRPLAQSVLENVADPEMASRLEINFTGGWDESTEFVRRGLRQHALQVWHSVTSPAFDWPGGQRVA